ncbi:MAG: polyprenol monophosphomannose synthase [Patescibacteria group bacterium]
MRICVVIPTYNEAENIKKITQEVFSLNIPGLEIVIVDDNSPDGTGKIADNLKVKEKRIHVIHRLGKLGLGTAYLEGFKYALDKGAEILFEMDADFSHNPKVLPHFLEAIKENDLVIGSRFIKGGKNDIGYVRQLVSRLGSLYARVVLGLKVKDLTGGFNCFRRKVLESINFDEVHSSNYAFQIEMKYRTDKKNFRIKEIPIIFTLRQKGETKFYYKMILESLWLVLCLRFKK